MKFKLSGNPNKPAALLIHAMFISDVMFGTVASLLEEDYLVILPTLDAHSPSEGSTFVSVQEEANTIIRYLQEHNRTEIEILSGSSLGGIIAFEVFRQNKIHIRHCFLDGAPFIRFSPLRIKLMAKVFQWIAHKSARNPEGKNILDKMFPNYAGDMKKICGRMSDESIKNLAAACYTYELPESICLGETQSVTFLYGTKEKASMCIPEIKKYTNCRLLIKEGCRHCEFLSREPRLYAEMLKNNGNETGGYPLKDQRPTN